MNVLGSFSSKHRSPLTDPRSLGATSLFHLALLLVVSLFAIRIGSPPLFSPPPAMQAEIGPVDNRATPEPAGGAPGDLGGTSLPESIRLSTESKNAKGVTPRDTAADALLADVLPAASPEPADEKTLPGPATTGVGLVPGFGAGGGGGSGGGSGGGIGKGVGPGTEFFGAKVRASSFAYVIDCSGSMSGHGALDWAKRELLSSLDQIPPDGKFAVVFYNMQPTILPDSSGNLSLMPATQENKSRVRTRLGSIRADGGTDHVKAIRAAIGLQPEAIFFLTDAEKMEEEDVEVIRAEAGKIRIQAVQFTDGPDHLGGSAPLRRLALATGGSFRHVDVSMFAKKPEREK